MSLTEEIKLFEMIWDVDVWLGPNTKQYAISAEVTFAWSLSQPYENQLLGAIVRKWIRELNDKLEGLERKESLNELYKLKDEHRKCHPILESIIHNFIDELED